MLRVTSECPVKIFRIPAVVGIISIIISNITGLVSIVSIIVGIVSIIIHGSAPLRKQEILGMPTMY